MNLDETSRFWFWSLKQNELEKAVSVILEGKGNATKADVQSTQIAIFTVDAVEMIQARLWSPEVGLLIPLNLRWALVELMWPMVKRNSYHRRVLIGS